MHRRSTRVRRTWLVGATLGLLGALVAPAPVVGQNQGAQRIVTETLIDFGSVWSYLDTGVDPGPDWRQPDFSDGLWARGPAELGYGDGDEATTISYGPNGANKHPVALFRTSFEIADVAELVAARIEVFRDDAAIVYLNGVELWRSSNLPPLVTLRTYATDAAENARNSFAVPLAALANGNNTLAVQVHNRAPDSTDLSFDLALQTDRAVTAPAEPNDAGATPAPSELEFSRERGFFTEPFMLTITAADPGAQILVSTEWGDEWLVEDFLRVARPYTGPIRVDASTQVRAVTTADDGSRGAVQSHSFIDLSGFSFRDREVIQSYPTFVTTADSVGERDVDARTITEYWRPDGTSTAAPAGIRNRQNGIEQNGDFRLYFRTEYGEGRLDYELFPNEPFGVQTPDSYDKVNFHGGSQDYLGPSWPSFRGCPIGNGTLLRDRYYQRLHREMSGDGPAGEYYFMWHQGRFVGVKNGEDVPHEGFMEGNFGRAKDDYGLWSFRSRDLPPGNAYDAVDDGGSFYDAIDVPNYIDYLLVQWFSGNSDWGARAGDNNVVVGGLFDGPYYHWVWDSHATSPGCAVNWGMTPLGLDTPLGDADFRMDFADRALMHFGTGGALSEPVTLARWEALAAELRPAVALVARLDEWELAQQHVLAQLTGTSGTLLSWLEAEGYVSQVPAVTYSVPAGAVGSGTRVALSGGAEIWFTTDGTDPRASGGGVADSAQRYSGPVSLPDGTVQMLARTKQGTAWSAARPMIFAVGDGPGLVINEINFHPTDGVAPGGGAIDGDEYEFVELANLGSTAVNLEYFRLQGGVRFKFDYGRSPVLQPGEFVVIAENAERFGERYGFAPDGEFLDKLSNSSDEIRLVDTELNTIDTVVYEDAWNPRADGNGASLSYLGEGDNNRAAAWGRSAALGGSPGAVNEVVAPQAAAVPAIIVNEWNAVGPERLLSGSDGRLGQVPGNGGDWFELVVVDDEVDARGWTIDVGDSDNTATLTLSQDPVWSSLRSGTIITIAERAVITSADGTTYREDASYDPAGRDWWIHAVAGAGGSGALVTAANFAVTADDWQATILDADGAIVWGPVGEGIGALGSGVGNTEIGELEADPSLDLDPATAPYDDGDDSTFGRANVFGGVRQNLAGLRAVVDQRKPAVEVSHTVTCLGANGRVDTNIVNTGEATAIYQLAFEGLSPREATVPPGDWARAPITGRADGSYGVDVRRDGELISQESVTVVCDTEPPQLTGGEVQVISACRDGAGYVLFQLVNATNSPRSWVIEFEGVPNRSTSAVGYGAAVRAVTGRSSGEYDYVVRAGFNEVERDTVTVDC